MLKQLASCLAFFVLAASSALAGDAVIFSGDYVKSLKAQFNLFDSAYILTGTADPSSVATTAPKGSIYLRQTAAGDGLVYVKSDNGSSTNWRLLGSSAASLTASRAVATDASGYLTVSATTATELGYVNGVTSAIQTQLNGKVDEVVSTDDAIVRFNGTGGSVQNSGVTLSDANAIAGAGIDADANTITNIENADIKAGAAIARNKLASGTADHVLINDGSGVMSSEAALSPTRGGTGVSNAAGETITLDGDDAITFTTTAATNVTLPTSGTLATNAAATPTTNGLVTSYFADINSSTTTDADDINISTTDGIQAVFMTAGGGTNQTVNLPAIADNLGRVLLIKKTGSSTGTVTVDPNSSETIDGASTNVLNAQYSYILIIGADLATDEWQVLSAGDYIASSAAGGAVMIGATINVASVSVPPGEWDVGGQLNASDSGADATTIVNCAHSVSTTTGTHSTNAKFNTFWGANALTDNNIAVRVAPWRTRLTAATTHYFVNGCGLTAGTSPSITADNTSYIWAIRSR